MRVLQFRRRWPTHSFFEILFWWTVVPALLRTFFRLVYRARWGGRDQIPRRGPIIYAANHQSHYDPPLIGCLAADRPFSSVAQSGLFSTGLSGWLMRQVGAIPLKRGQSDVSAVRIAIAQLKLGGCVLIFPEGGRTRDGVLGPFHRGVLVLVRRSKAAVVPVAVDGTYDVFGIGRRFPRLKGRIGVKFGGPIAAEELLNDPPEVALERLRRAIETMRLDLRNQMREATAGRYPTDTSGDTPYRP